MLLVLFLYSMRGESLMQNRHTLDALALLVACTNRANTSSTACCLALYLAVNRALLSPMEAASGQSPGMFW